MAKNLRWYINHMPTELSINYSSLQLITLELLHETLFLTKMKFPFFSSNSTLTNLVHTTLPPFTTGKIVDDTGPYGDNDVVGSTLYGNTAHATLELKTEDVDKELDALLQSLQRDTTPDGTPISYMDNTIILDTSKQPFVKIRKKTASSPSKLYMVHYIASCEHDKIVHVHLTMMNISFHYEFTLERWRHSIHCMLLKRERPVIDKLQIIQLMETDFNAAMEIIISR